MSGDPLRTSHCNVSPALAGPVVRTRSPTLYSMRKWSVFRLSPPLAPRSIHANGSLRSFGCVTQHQRQDRSSSDLVGLCAASAQKLIDGGPVRNDEISERWRDGFVHERRRRSAAADVPDLTAVDSARRQTAGSVVALRGHAAAINSTRLGWSPSSLQTWAYNGSASANDSVP